MNVFKHIWLWLFSLKSVDSHLSALHKTLDGLTRAESQHRDLAQRLNDKSAKLASAATFADSEVNRAATVRSNIANLLG